MMVVGDGQIIINKSINTYNHQQEERVEYEGDVCRKVLWPQQPVAATQ
jgi:hypothetical protein